MHHNKSSNKVYFILIRILELANEENKNMSAVAYVLTLFVIPPVEIMHSDWIIAMIYFLMSPPNECHMSHDANGTWIWRGLLTSQVTTT